jgi:predicted  nucleic acid-binding Zn-ribbon protein
MFAFDTLKLARDLRENAAFSPEQAEGLAAAISSAVQDNVPAKSETAAEFAAVRSEITALRTDMKMEFAALRADFLASQKDVSNEFAGIRAESSAYQKDARNEFAAIRADSSAYQKDTRNEFAAIRSEMKLLEQRMTIKLGAMLAAFAGILIAAMRFLIH